MWGRWSTIEIKMLVAQAASDDAGDIGDGEHDGGHDRHDVMVNGQL